MQGDTAVAEPWRTTYSLVVQQDVVLFPSRALIVSGAARLESILHSDGVGNDITYRNVSPRVALISKVGDNHDVRVTAASAYRLPSTLEASSGSVYPAAPGEPPRRLVVPNTALVPEQTQSVELGYRGDLWDRFRLEVVAYEQRLYDVVNVYTFNGLPFVYENGPDIGQVGLETAGTVLVSSHSSIYGHFAARRTRQEGSVMREWPGYILGFGTDNTIRRSVRVHGDLSLVLDYETSALDVQPGTPLIQSRSIDVPEQIDLNLRVGKLLWDGRAEVFTVGRNLAAFVRDRDDLTQLPPYPVGATVLVGLSLFEG
jgi:hypothetical protein